MGPGLDQALALGISGLFQEREGRESIESSRAALNTQRLKEQCAYSSGIGWKLPIACGFFFLKKH